MKKSSLCILLLYVCMLPSCSIFKNKHDSESVQLISQLYEQLGPRIGVHLVEPNVVIALSGLRGYGHFSVSNLSEFEKQKLEKINNSSKNLRFIVTQYPGDKMYEILVINFKGLEYSSKKSRLPFVDPFDSKRGFEGFKKWFKETLTKAENYFKNNYSKEGLSHLIIGLELGYPDQALLDLYNTFTQKENRKSSLATIYIPYSDYYSNPEPNFQYLPEHENESSIIETKESWGNALKQFYSSSWHKSIEKNPVFVCIRKSEEENKKTYK